MRRLLLPLAVVLVALVGCSEVEGTEGKQWITGEGKIIQIPPGERGEPVEAEGTTLDGEELSLADHRGSVVVTNTWASWCPPCRKEMPLVVKLDEESGDDVVVLGINIRDNKANAEAFVRNAGMEFPSFYDPGSRVLLALSDEIGPYSLPSTAVLDRKGRLAALVLGEIPGRATMRDLIQEVVEE